MTTSTPSLDQNAIDIVEGRALLFLMDRRCIQHDDGWFTVRDVASHLDLGDHYLTCLCALIQLAGRGKVETFQRRFRHP